MARNKATIQKAVENYKNQVIIPTMEAELKKWCSHILDAAIKARQKNPQAHNFTGNLLNSIVVCLYKNGRPIIAYFSSDIVPEAIMPKMKKRLRKRVFFKRDYDGEESAYLPTIETNGGWGKDDAQEFFESYKPKGNNLFTNGTWDCWYSQHLCLCRTHRKDISQTKIKRRRHEKNKERNQGASKGIYRLLQYDVQQEDNVHEVPSK